MNILFVHYFTMYHEKFPCFYLRCRVCQIEFPMTATSIWNREVKAHKSMKEKISCSLFLKVEENCNSQTVLFSVFAAVRATTSVKAHTAVLQYAVSLVRDLVLPLLFMALLLLHDCR